jgi:hypothetical protein
MHVGQKLWQNVLVSRFNLMTIKVTQGFCPRLVKKVIVTQRIVSTNAIGWIQGEQPVKKVNSIRAEVACFTTCFRHSVHLFSQYSRFWAIIVAHRPVL